MKGVQRVLIIAGCVAVLAISWLSAVTATTDSQRQAELLEQAHLLLEDEIYIRAIPLLEEAAGYDEDEYYHRRRDLSLWERWIYHAGVGQRNGI